LDTGTGGEKWRNKKNGRNLKKQIKVTDPVSLKKQDSFGGVLSVFIVYNYAQNIKSRSKCFIFRAYVHKKTS